MPHSSRRRVVLGAPFLAPCRSALRVGDHNSEHQGLETQISSSPQGKNGLEVEPQRKLKYPWKVKLSADNSE